MEMREAFGQGLVSLGQEFKQLYVLDADLNTSTRTVLYKEAYPQRFIQVGIAEQNLVGVAAGLAVEGKIPIACTFADFLTKRACDQVSISVAYPKLNVKLAGAYSGLFAGACGATHQSVQDLANMRAMPNMKIAAPTDINELNMVMRKAIEYAGPVYFRIPRIAPAREITEGYEFDWGKGYKLIDGTDLTIVGTGIASQWAFSAAGELNERGISARMLHMPSIKPIDKELIIAAANETGCMVTVENHSVIGGLGSAVSEVATSECPIFINRIGIQDRFGDTGFDDELIEEFGLSVHDIIRAAKDVMVKKNNNIL